MDQGGIWTEIYIKRMEKRVREVYEEAEKDIEEKMQDFNKRYLAKRKIHYQDVKSGKWTQEQYDRWVAGQVFQGKQWKAKKEQIAEVLYNSNVYASKIANEQRANVFAINANYQAYTLEHGAGINFGFGLYDSATVVNLIKNEPQVLPYYTPKKSKDMTWNMRNISRQITQGIVQGESLDKIAKRLARETGSRNMNSMLTNARTGMTMAQNAGREYRLREAEGMGIKVHKEWMATLDEVTRYTHRMLDGQKRPLNKPFTVEGYSIMFPGDPTAHPSLVFNCRCTLVGDLDDYPAEYERYDNIDGKPVSQMTYTEWYNAKKSTVVSSTPVKPKSVIIKNIMNSPTTAQMTIDQKAEFEKLLNSMSDEHLELYEVMAGFHTNNNYISGKGWYLPTKHIVEMNLSNTDWEESIGRPSVAAWKVKFHEELHQLDHILGITQGYGVYSDISKGEKDTWGAATPIGIRLKNAIEKDVLDFINTAIGYYNSEHSSKVSLVTDLNKPINSKVKSAFFEYLELMYGSDEKSRASISSFTDAVGLSTRGRLDPHGGGYWGHSKKYDKETGINGATSECLAEIGSHIMRGDTEMLNILREVMPTSVSEFESVIHELAVFVKGNKIHY